MSVQKLKPVSWIEQVNLINRLILNSYIIMTVFSEKRGGKTTFLKFLKTALAKEIYPIYFAATPLVDEGVLCDQMSQAFALDNERCSSLMEVVREINQHKQHVFLMIDDAHHLPMILIENLLLAMGQQEVEGYFHICLASEYSLVETLNKLANGQFQNQIHGFEVGDLVLSETTQYVLKCLPNKETYEKAFTEENMSDFQQMTGGKISIINQQMLSYFQNKAIQAFYQLTSKRIFGLNFGFIRAVWDKISFKPWFLLRKTVLGASAIAALIYILRPEWLPSLEFSTQDLMRVATIAVPSQENNMPMASVHNDSVFPTVLAGAKQKVMEVAEASPSQLASANEEHLLPSSLVAIRASDFRHIAQQTKHSHIKVPNISHHASHGVAKQTNLSKKTSTVAEKALAQLNPRYTIQVIASKKLKDIYQFQKAHHIRNFKIMKSHHHQETWYVLTIGQYQAREEAKIAFAKLSPQVTRYKPWIRAMSDLKAHG